MSSLKEGSQSSSKPWRRTKKELKGFDLVLAPLPEKRIWMKMEVLVVALEGDVVPSRPMSGQGWVMSQDEHVGPTMWLYNKVQARYSIQGAKRVDNQEQ